MQRQDLSQQLPAELQPLAQAVTTARLRRLLGVLDRRIGGLAVVVEAVHRRHNVSAILRSSEAFGLHEAHLVCNHFKPVKGAAKGAERWLDLSLHPDTPACVRALRARGFALYVCDLAEDAVTPEQVPVDRPVALLFGGELTGVSPEARELADGVVRLPMLGVTQSLNVSVAAGVILREVAARRASHGGAGALTATQRHAFCERFLRQEARRKKAWRHLVEG